MNRLGVFFCFNGNIWYCGGDERDDLGLDQRGSSDVEECSSPLEDPRTDRNEQVKAKHRFNRH